MRRLAVFLSTVGYIGYAPYAPGTVGSAAGLVVLYAIRTWGTPTVEVGTILALFALGVWSSTLAEKHFGQKDPPSVVIDEVVGMLMTLCLLPVKPLGAFMGFVTFRIFDVIKPFPSAQCERLPGGLGVMFDDGMAAIYAYLIMRALFWLVPAWVS
jgi:phosphatidylglycerophosphatase A